MRRRTNQRPSPLALVDGTATTDREEYEIASLADLERCIKSIVNRNCGTVYYFPEGYPGKHMLVGVEGSAALAFYDPWDEGPYLWATGSKSAESIEFDFAGTGTTIRANRCISVEEMWEIISYFYKCHELHPSGRWEEDDA